MIKFSASVERINLKITENEDRIRVELADVKLFEDKFVKFFTRFESKLNSNRLLKGEVDKVNVVLAETLKFLNKYTQNEEVTNQAPTTLIEDEAPTTQTN